VSIGSISKNWHKTMNKIVVVVFIDWDNIIVQILEWMKMMVFFFHVLKTHDGDHSLHVLKDGVCLLNNMFMKMMILFVSFYKYQDWIDLFFILKRLFKTTPSRRSF
jgi:hypothetical protein